MPGFDPKFRTPEEYIIGITNEIWEGRGVDELDHYYAPDIPVRSPMGSSIGNKAVIDATWATLSEFPDRELLGEDVIWSDDGNGDGGFLSSHRIMSTATHLGDGSFGAPTGTKLAYRIIADCAARDNAIYDEWLIRDLGAIVRQIGHTPRDFAAAQIEAEGGAADASRPLTPSTSPAAIYTGRGNDHQVGQHYATMLSAVAHGDESVIEAEWDRAVQLESAGGSTGHGWLAIREFWSQMRTALPDAKLTIEHQIGRDDPELGKRAALRWWFSGTHSGPGLFGEPTGAPVHVMGLSHAEFGPWGLRREWTLYDEVAVWKQILLG